MEGIILQKENESLIEKDTKKRDGERGSGRKMDSEEEREGGREGKTEGLCEEGLILTACATDHFRCKGSQGRTETCPSDTEIIQVFLAFIKQ